MPEELRGVQPLRSLLMHRPIGLFSDIDGTLAPIVANPGDAQISPRCREWLHALMAEGVVVALLTGRPLETARRMTGLDDAVYAANHGLTVWIDGRDETSDVVRGCMPVAQQIFNETAAIAVNGVFVEVSGPNLAFHYRRAADPTTAREAILSAIAASRAAARYRSREGRKVIELRPPLDIDKGTALTDLVRRLKVAALVCLGDDQTDIDMFRATAKLREDGLPTASIAVDSEEATPEMLASADYFVRGIQGVEAFLGNLLTALRREGP